MPPRKKTAPKRLPKSLLPATKAQQFAEISMRLRNLEADVGLRETSPTFRALKAEVIDLRQAFVILLKRHDGHTLPLIDKLKHDFRAVLATLPDFELGKIEALERRLNIMNEEVKALRNGLVASHGLDNRMDQVEEAISNTEQRIVALEERNPPGPSVRKRVGDLEVRLNLIEDSDLLTHQRLHKLEGDEGYDREEQADNSKPFVIKGGWVNIYQVSGDGLPLLSDHPTSGVFETRSKADEHHVLFYESTPRLACLYLEGSESTDEFPDPEPWVDHD